VLDSSVYKDLCWTILQLNDCVVDDVKQVLVTASLWPTIEKTLNCFHKELDPKTKQCKEFIEKHKKAQDKAKAELLPMLQLTDGKVDEGDQYNYKICES